MKNLGITFVILILVGCASSSPKTNAIHYALTTSSALSQLEESCSEVGSAEKNTAKTETNEWWKRNGSLVIAADFGLLQLNWDQNPEGTETQRAYLAMQLLESIQLDSKIRLAELTGNVFSVKSCGKIYKRIAKGKLDISNKKKELKLLVKIQNNWASVKEDTDAARSINARYRKYGRSYIIVEKVLKQGGCMNPNISLLRDQWPIEVYDAACNRDDYMLVQCEWGRCEIKK